MATKRGTRAAAAVSGESFSALSISNDVFAAKATAVGRYLKPRPFGALAAREAMNPAAAPDPSENVVAIGVGEKMSKGISTGIPAVKIFVRVKFADSEIGDDDRLPTEINGVPVDVEQIGTVRAFKAPTIPNPRVKIRPARPGCSVGFLNPNFRMAGTFGAVAKKGQKLFILSNNHVLADENRLPIGSPIVQPGALDGGKSTDAIAKLTAFVPLDPLVPNKVDAAIAAVDKPSLVNPSILFIGRPKGTKRATIDMTVQKFGRTTSFRVGRVVSVATDVRVAYDVGELVFEDQIIIRGLNGEQFSAAGDSGSLILERSTNAAVGLLFAGSSTHTIGNHIGDVLTALGVKLA